jgi:two-component system alkaline phosphatase synthesis response regulator PhoP
MLGLFKQKNKSAVILVVDDEPDLVNTVKSRLEWHKFSVETASNGRQGLEVAAQVKPDLILLDCNMPEMTGLQMLEKMRQDKELQDIPVIMLTAASESRDINTAASFNVAEYITKPFDFAQLLGKISQILDKK